ncbi:MAG TPA: hypothetical protein VGX68_01595 [Thermoanaerobaculia bacterium]|jgi:hypothetical protein|nr:hypothetical protein [Thermoanaerobaculia bacterium]
MAKQPVMFVENSTDDDAVCKVSGGTGGIGKGQQWKLPKKKIKKLPPLTIPCTLHFSIEIGDQEVTSAMKGLRLLRGANGLQVEVVKNGAKP